MEGKLIKLELSEGYRLDDLNGNYIASTLNGKNKLSLKNCLAIENGYDLDELADYHFGIVGSEGISSTHSFKVGFQKALEILGDKKFSEVDMIEFAKWTFLEVGSNTGKDRTNEQLLLEWKSLQQTEWDVTFNPDEKDSEGCLILKRL